jgi:putative DNA primase/helicase
VVDAVVSPAVERLLEEAEPTWRSPLAEVEFARERPDHDVNAAVLSVAAPFDNARTYARRHCYRDDALGVFHWHEKWWQWNNQIYSELPGDQLRAYVFSFLDKSTKREGKEGERLARFRPTPGNVNDLLNSLQSGLLLPAWAHPPMRLDTGEGLGDVMMFANGLFNVRTGERMTDPTAAYWLHAAVPYELRADAECPEWLAFLERAFPGDPDAHAVVEEALGLSMNEDRSFQKGMMLVGEPRSGKGTILAVLEGLLGSATVSVWT